MLECAISRDALRGAMQRAAAHGRVHNNEALDRLEVVARSAQRVAWGTYRLGLDACPATLAGYDGTLFSFAFAFDDEITAITGVRGPGVLNVVS